MGMIMATVVRVASEGCATASLEVGSPEAGLGTLGARSCLVLSLLPSRFAVKEIRGRRRGRAKHGPH